MCYLQFLAEVLNVQHVAYVLVMYMYGMSPRKAEWGWGGSSLVPRPIRKIWPGYETRGGVEPSGVAHAQNVGQNIEPLSF